MSEHLGLMARPSAAQGPTDKRVLKEAAQDYGRELVLPL